MLVEDNGDRYHEVWWRVFARVCRGHPLAFSVKLAPGTLGIGQSHGNQIVRHWFFSPAGGALEVVLKADSTVSPGQT